MNVQDNIAALKPNFLAIQQQLAWSQGHGAASRLTEAIIDTTTRSLENLPLMRPLEKISLEVAGGQRRGGTALSDNWINLRLQPRSDRRGLAINLDTISHAVPHEIGHIAHWQHNPEIFDQRKAESEHRFLWTRAIVEGVAIYAANSFSTETWHPITDDMIPSISDDLVDLLCDPDFDRRERYADFRNRIHTLGKYVVSLFMQGHSISLEELMQLPICEFTGYAQEKL